MGTASVWVFVRTVIRTISLIAVGIVFIKIGTVFTSHDKIPLVAVMLTGIVRVGMRAEVIAVEIVIEIAAFTAHAQ